jgi:hypothetical protein
VVVVLAVDTAVVGVSVVVVLAVDTAVVGVSVTTDDSPAGKGSINAAASNKNLCSSARINDAGRRSRFRDPTCGKLTHSMVSITYGSLQWAAQRLSASGQYFDTYKTLLVAWTS